jgi:hypothetical protein
MEPISVVGGDGRRYQVDVGFLSTSEALAAIQDRWAAKGLGGANWRGIVQLFDSAEAMSDTECPPGRNVCVGDEELYQAPRAELVYPVHVRDYVWQSLLDDYLARGLQGVLQNPFYGELQSGIFGWLGGSRPNTPSVGVVFERQG